MEIEYRVFFLSLPFSLQQQRTASVSSFSLSVKVLHSKRVPSLCFRVTKLILFGLLGDCLLWAAF
jgi:hypothetical protein